MATPLIPEAEAAEKLTRIFAKIFPATARPGGDPADFAALFRNGIIDGAEFEFLVSNRVACDRKRQSLTVEVQPPGPNSHTSLTVGRRAPTPKPRNARLEEIATLIDRARPAAIEPAAAPPSAGLSGLAAASSDMGGTPMPRGTGVPPVNPVACRPNRKALPPSGPFNPEVFLIPAFLNVQLTEHAGISIRAGLLMVGLGAEHSEALPAVRTLLRTAGLKIMFDHRVPAVQMVEGKPAMAPGTAICSEIPPAYAESIGGLVQRLLQACGLTARDEIAYSSQVMDEREPGFVAAVGEVHVGTATSSVRCSTDDDFSPAELGRNVDPGQFDFIRASIAAATQEAPGVQVTAAELLASAALVAREKFGADAAARLRALGLDSSSAFGRALYQLVDAGIFSTSAEDDPKDFEIRSEFDTIFES